MSWKSQSRAMDVVATATVVELPDEHLYMFLSNQADVLREVRAFADTLQH